MTESVLAGCFAARITPQPRDAMRLCQTSRASQILSRKVERSAAATGPAEPEAVSKVEHRQNATEANWQRRRLVVLGLLIAFSLTVHVYRLQAQSLWWDETLSYHRAASDISYILSNKIVLNGIDTVDQHPPVYFLLLKLALSLFGISEFALRLPSAVYTVLVVPLLYVLGRRLFDERTGIVAAGIASFSPYLLYYGQEARPYGLLAALGTASAYFLIRAYRSDEKAFFLAYLVTALLMVLVHYLALLLILAQAAYIGVNAVLGPRRRQIVALAGFAILAVILAPVLQYLFIRLADLRDSRLQAPITDVLRDLSLSFSFGVTVDQLAVLPYGSGILLIALVALSTGWASQGREGLVFILTSLALPIAVFYGIAQFKPIYNTRYSVFLAPMLYLLLAVGVARLMRQNRLLGGTAAAYLAVIGAAGIFHYFYYGQDNPWKANFRDSIAYIEQHSRAGDAIILADARLASAFDYYYRGNVPIFAVPSRYGQATPEIISSEIGELARSYQRMWSIIWIPSDMDPEGLTLRTLTSGYPKTDERAFVSREAAVTVALFSASPHAVSGLPGDATPLEFSFGNQLSLVGYRIAHDEPASSQVRVTLYWRSDQPGLPALKMFGQLVDAEGQAWASFDGEPFSGFSPTNTWKEDELTADERTLSVTPGAPRGAYDLRLGVRDHNGSILPVRSPTQDMGRFVKLKGPVLQTTGVETALANLDLPNYYHADFADRLLLVGSDLQRRSPRPGDSLDLRLFWRTLGKLSPNVRVVLSLMDDLGGEQTLAELPLSTLHPAHLWEPGDLVGASYPIRIPGRIAAGRYRLNVSLVTAGDPPFLGVRSGLDPRRARSLEIGALEVQETPRIYGLPVMDFPVGNDFAGIRALGFKLNSGEARATADREVPVLKTPIATGLDSLGVSMFWQPLAEIDHDYKVFVQLLDANGKLVAQHDGLPQNGSRPTTSWLPGEVIEDYHEITGLGGITPGVYTVIVGLYDSNTEKRLDLADGQGDHLVLFNFIIQS